MLIKRILLLLSMLLFGCADSNVDSYQQLMYRIFSYNQLK